MLLGSKILFYEYNSLDFNPSIIMHMHKMYFLHTQYYLLYTSYYILFYQKFVTNYNKSSHVRTKLRIRTPRTFFIILHQQQLFRLCF